MTILSCDNSSKLSVKELLKAVDNRDVNIWGDFEKWSIQPPRSIDKHVLYVSQREYAVVDPRSRGDLKFISSDSATTCHIIAIIHPDTKTIGLGHLDGCNTEQGVSDLLTLIANRVSLASQTNRNELNSTIFELHLFGGFVDERGHSRKLTEELLEFLDKTSHQLSLQTLLVGHSNSVYRGLVCYPIVFGIAVDCDSLEITNANCECRGPDEAIKGCRNFVGPKNMVSCYDLESRRMFLDPFYFKALERVEIWLKQTDEVLLKYLSTSPEQEPPHFVSSVRQSLELMLKHPISSSLFKDESRRYYVLQDGYWIPE